MRATAVLTAFAAFALGACAGERAPESAQTEDSMTVASAPTVEPRTNLLSTAYADVFTITLAPGQSLPAHTSGARTIYSLSDYTVRFTQDGQTTEQPATAGQAHFHPAGEHSLENIGATEARFLVVVRTAQALPPAVERKSTAAPGGSGPMQLLLNNDDVIVAEVRLPAGASLPRHPGRARIAYSLSDYTISYALNDEAAETKSFVTGDTHWHDADEHTIVNTGSTEARFLLVQFKR